MEYEQFYKFLENRPVQELNDCVHRIVNMIGSRFTEQKAPPVSQNHVSIGFGTQLGTETVKAESIKKLIVRDGYLLPHGMSGYHKSDLRFIRWFPGYHGPVPNPNTFSLEHKLPTDWFLDKELQVWLNWNPDGYFEMSRKDSLKFNQNNPSNKNLVEEARRINSSNAEKRKAESVTGSVDRKRSRSSDLPAPAAITTSQPAPRFKYLSSTSESESNSEDEADEADVHMNTEPTEADKHDSEMTPEDVEKELVRQNSTASSATAAPFTPPPTPTVPSKPIKGDTVFITGGKYANSEGTVMGGNEKAYRVQIPNLVDPGSIIAQVPIEMVTLVRPTASCSAGNNTDPSESYLSALKRISDRPKPKPLSQLSAAANSSATTASATSAVPAVIEKNSNKQPKAKAHDKMHVDQDDKDSVDEFFSYLASSDKDYFSSDKSAPVVGENSTVITAKNKASSHSTAHTTTIPGVPTVSQSSEVSADSVAPRNGGASEGSFPTESLTTPPDMARDAETVSSMGLSLEMEIERETGGTLETYTAPAPAVPIHAVADIKVAAAPAHRSLQALAPVSTLSTASSAASTPVAKKPKRVGRPNKNKDGTYSKPWSFKCKCGEVCSSYENASYHPVGQWYECSQCTVWSHVECMLGSVTITQVQEMEEVLCFSCKSKARRNRQNRDQSLDKSGEVDGTSAPVQTTTTDGVKAVVAKVQPSLRAERTTPVPAATTTTPTTSTDTFVKVVVETVQSKPSTVAAAPSSEPVVSAEKSPAEAVVTLPVKITTAVKPIVTHLSDSASEKAKEAKEAKPRSHKRKAHTTSASSSPASSRLLHVGQRVTLLRGQHRNEEAEVIDVARAGPVVLPDVYKVKLCAGDDKDKILQMPLEFLTKKENSEQSGDSKVAQSEMSTESSTEDHQHRSTPAAVVSSVPHATVPVVDAETPANPVAPTSVIVLTPEPAPEPTPVVESPAPPAESTLVAPAPVAESAPDQSLQSTSALTAAPAAPAPPTALQHFEVHHSLSHSNLSDMSPEEVQQALVEVEQDEKLNDAPAAGEESSAAAEAEAEVVAEAIAVEASAPLPPVEQTDTTVVHLPEKEPSVHPLLRWQPQGQAYDNVAK